MKLSPEAMPPEQTGGVVVSETNEDVEMTGHDAGVYVDEKIRQREKRGGVFKELLGRLRNRKQRAPEFPDQREVVITPQSQQVQVKMSEGLNPRQVPVTEKATGNKVVGEVPDLQPLNHRVVDLTPFQVKEKEPIDLTPYQVQEDASEVANKSGEELIENNQETTERPMTVWEQRMSNLDDRLNGMLEAGKEALKASLAKAHEKFTPDKLKDLFEARDVKKNVESSAVFQNRESAIKRSVGLTHAITEKSASIANIDSLIAREKAAMSDAVKQKTLRRQLAESDDELIQMAEETYNALHEQIEERITALESQKVPLVAERDMLIAQKENTKAVIRADNKRLETLVEGKVENLKAKVGFEQIVEQREVLKAELESSRSSLIKLNALITSLEATIEAGEYGKEQIKLVKARLKAVKATAKTLRTSNDKTQSEYNEAVAKSVVLETRFKAMTDVLPKIGVIKESKIKDENKVVSTQTTGQGTTASVQPQPEAQESQSVTLPEYVLGEDYNDPNNLPEDVYEEMFDNTSAVEVSRSSSESKEDPRITSLKDRFNQIFGGIKDTQKTRPDPQDINKLTRIVKDFWAIRTDKTNELSPLVEQLQAMKNDSTKRAEKMALLRQIQSKLN